MHGFDNLSDDCNEALEAMYLFLDGEMPAEQVVVVKQHLKACGDCFEVFDFEAEIKLMVKEKCCEEPPPEFKARLQQFLAESGTGPAQSEEPGKV